MISASRTTDDSKIALSLERCRAILDSHYGPRFEGLVLYGSRARGTAGKESDLDLLVLLDGDFDFFAELRTVTALLYPVQLDSEHLISARPAAATDFEAGVLQLYRNAAREGRRV